MCICTVIHTHNTHTAELLFVLPSKVAEGVEKLSLCTQKLWDEKAGGGLNSCDESLAISCSSPCLSTAVIASGCWEIIAFLSVFSNSCFSPSHFLPSLILCPLCSLFSLRHISHSLVVFLSSTVRAKNWPACGTVLGYFVFPPCGA